MPAFLVAHLHLARATPSRVVWCARGLPLYLAPVGPPRAVCSGPPGSPRVTIHRLPASPHLASPLDPFPAFARPVPHSSPPLLSRRLSLDSGGRASSLVSPVLFGQLSTAGFLISSSDRMSRVAGSIVAEAALVGSRAELESSDPLARRIIDPLHRGPMVH